MAQFGSAPDWGSGGRKFKSCHPNQKILTRVSFFCAKALRLVSPTLQHKLQLATVATDASLSQASLSFRYYAYFVRYKSCHPNQKILARVSFFCAKALRLVSPTLQHKLQLATVATDVRYTNKFVRSLLRLLRALQACHPNQKGCLLHPFFVARYLLLYIQLYIYLHQSTLNCNGYGKAYPKCNDKQRFARNGKLCIGTFPTLVNKRENKACEKHRV